MKLIPKLAKTLDKIIQLRQLRLYMIFKELMQLLWYLICLTNNHKNLNLF